MHGDQLILAETLISVLELGSFTAAAQKLGTSQSTISRRIAALEQKLGGTPLFHRGVRWIEPTQEAKDYVQNIREIIRLLETADSKVRDGDAEPSGVLRLSIPPALGRAKLALPLARLTEQYPKLRLRIDFSEDYVDLRDGTTDLVVRIKPLEQAGISITKIGDSKLGLYASPSYLNTPNPPASMRELTGANIIGLSSFFERDVRNFTGRQKKFFGTLQPKILANDFTAILEMIAGGIGMGFLPDYLASRLVRQGKLVLCPISLNMPMLEIYALYPYSLRDSPRLDCTLKALVKALV